VKLPRRRRDALPQGLGVNLAALTQATGVSVDLAAIGMADGTEAEFQSVVVQIAERAGWKVFHVVDSRFVTASGFPDLAFKRELVVVVAELKRRGEKPRADQWEWLRAFEACGVRSYFWTPDDLEEIREVLR
jgi:Ethanolamine utilization protein EutJ (predicted chaperonin)